LGVQGAIYRRKQSGIDDEIFQKNRFGINRHTLSFSDKAGRDVLTAGALFVKLSYHTALAEKEEKQAVCGEIWRKKNRTAGKIKAYR
jgi:hypothetical protein